MLEVEFSSDATTWPPVEHVDVINYLIFTPSAYTSDQLKNTNLWTHTSFSRMAGSRRSYTISLRICNCFLRRLIVLSCSHARRTADRRSEYEQVVVLDASRQSDCIDVLCHLSHAHRETCPVRGPDGLVQCTCCGEGLVEIKV